MRTLRRRASPVRAGPESGGAPLRARSELMARKLLRTGWILTAAGLIVPPVALVGAVYGLAAGRYGRRSGWLLCLVAVSVFAARLGFWLASS